MKTKKIPRLRDRLHLKEGRSRLHGRLAAVQTALRFHEGTLRPRRGTAQTRIAAALIEYKRLGGSAANVRGLLRGEGTRVATLPDFAEGIAAALMESRWSRSVIDVQPDLKERSVLVYLDGRVKGQLEAIATEIGESCSVEKVEDANTPGAFVLKIKYESGQWGIPPKNETGMACPNCEGAMQLVASENDDEEPGDDDAYECDECGNVITMTPVSESPLGKEEVTGILAALAEADLDDLHPRTVQQVAAALTSGRSSMHRIAVESGVSQKAVKLIKKHLPVMHEEEPEDEYGDEEYGESARCCPNCAGVMTEKQESYQCVSCDHTVPSAAALMLEQGDPEDDGEGDFEPSDTDLESDDDAGDVSDPGDDEDDPDSVEGLRRRVERQTITTESRRQAGRAKTEVVIQYLSPGDPCLVCGEALQEAEGVSDVKDGGQKSSCPGCSAATAYPVSWQGPSSSTDKAEDDDELGDDDDDLGESDDDFDDEDDLGGDEEGDDGYDPEDDEDDDDFDGGESRRDARGSSRGRRFRGLSEATAVEYSDKEDREPEDDEYESADSPTGDADDFDQLSPEERLEELIALVVEDGEQPDAEDLELWIENDGNLQGDVDHVRKNMMRKMVAGKYEHRQAAKGWLSIVDRGADAYARDLFSEKVRMETAQLLADAFLDEVKSGEYSPGDFGVKGDVDVDALVA